MRFEADNSTRSTAAQNIRVVLQFDVQSNGLPLHKEVILELEPYDNDRNTITNPIHLINQTTAAILQLLGGTAQNTGKSPVPPLTHNIQFKLKGFTPREMEVFTYLIAGITNAEIATTLGISTNTIKFHVKKIFQKLQVKNRVELVGKFIQM